MKALRTKIRTLRETTSTLTKDDLARVTGGMQATHTVYRSCDSKGCGQDCGTDTD